MDEKSSESDISRGNSPRNSQEHSSAEDQVKTKREKSHSPTPDTSLTNDTQSQPLSADHTSPHENHSQPSPEHNSPYTSQSLPLSTTAHDSTTVSLQTTLSSTNHMLVTTPSSAAMVADSTPTTLSESPTLVTTARQNSRGSSSSKSTLPSPLGSGSVSPSGSLHPTMLLSQSEQGAKGSEANSSNNNMLTLGSYVQFMTLQQQSQMGYQTLLQSACLPPSVANPPTTLPPQYETNFSQTYSPSLSSFGCAAGLIPQQLNQGLITLDVPMAATAVSSSAVPHSKGMDPHHRFMVSGPIPGTLPGQDVARAIGGVGLPLVVAGRNDGGPGTMREGGEYKRSRKRSYSQTNQDMQDAGDLHEYNGSMRRSVFPAEDHCSISGESSSTTSAAGTSGSGGGGSSPQQLKWQAHQVDTWHDLCDGVLQDIPQIGFTVETDKGFVFSVADDAFVCQKKNHFQVTVTTVFHRTPKFIKIKGGSIHPVEKFMLCLHGVKLESVGTTIRLEQSMTDRRRSSFIPVEVIVPVNAKEPAKYTVCRLHFGETTANNMRKRGKPNPDQKFFSLVVGLNAVCELGSFPVVAHVSERIIVRASNPGNFDNDCDYLWLKSSTPDSIYHHGRVGINTDKPEEALSVNGNIRVTGCIEHPSDMRIKTDILPVDSGRQLESVCRMKLYQYRYKDGVMRGAHSSHAHREQVGVLAQELREIIPNAVHETNTDVPLSDGNTVTKLLVVDKDRVLMEAVGAIKGLKHIVDNVSERLVAVEEGLAQTESNCQREKLNSCKVFKSNEGTLWGSAFGIILTFLLGCFVTFTLVCCARMTT